MQKVLTSDVLLQPPLQAEALKGYIPEEFVQEVVTEEE